MKRLATLLALFCFTLFAVGCGETETPPAGNGTGSDTKTDDGTGDKKPSGDSQDTKTGNPSKTPADDTKTPADDTKTPADDAKTPADGPDLNTPTDAGNADDAAAADDSKAVPPVTTPVDDTANDKDEEDQ